MEILYVEKAEIKFSNEKVVVLNGLQTNRKYKVNENGEATAYPISAPQLKSPARYSMLNSVKGNLEWFISGGAISYEILIALDVDFSNIVTTLNSTTNTKEYDLEANKTYYWKVRAKDETTAYKWSDIWSFTTNDGSPKPQSTTLIAPLNLSTGIARDAELKWQLVTGMKAVNIQIATDANFTANLRNILKQNNNMPTNYFFTENPLNATTKYYWRVRVSDQMDVQGNANWSEWTQTWEFTTGTAVSVLDCPVIKSGLNFSGISPNPVTDNASLSFSISNSSNLDISIFDNEGKLIKVLENKQFNSGEYKLNYNLSDFPSGIYHFRISDGRIIMGRKVNIVR